MSKRERQVAAWATEALGGSKAQAEELASIWAVEAIEDQLEAGFSGWFTAAAAVLVVYHRQLAETGLTGLTGLVSQLREALA